MAASDTFFRLDSEDLDSRVSESDSHASTGLHGSDEGSGSSVVRAALAHLHLDVPQALEVSDSVFLDGIDQHLHSRFPRLQTMLSSYMPAGLIQERCHG